MSCQRGSRMNVQCLKIRLFILSFLVLGESLVQSQSTTPRQMLEDEYSQDCMKDLNAADANGDLGLSSEEYIAFVDTRSGGRIDVSAYEDLPLSLISNFVFGACLCTAMTGDSSCCIGDAAAINLDQDDPSYSSDSLVNFCLNVDAAIESEVGPMPEPPTSSPTVVETDRPTRQPTAQPTTPEPTEETMPPTLGDLACVTFQYGIVNDEGFDAEEIYNEVGNTLKTGLIIATRNVTIEVLNVTFPRTESLRLLRGSETIYRGNSRIEEEMKSFDSNGLRNLFNIHNTGALSSNSRVNNDRVGKMRHRERQLVYLTEDIAGSNSKLKINDRRLVFYTDEAAPVINSITDNPFCQRLSENTHCSVVSSSVCVVLEEGDDEDEVEDVLLEGIGDSILNGDFEAAIPPENQLPN